MLPVTPRLPPAVSAAGSVPSGRLQRFPPIPASSQPRAGCPPLLHAISSCPKPRQLTGFIAPQPPPSCSSAAVMGWQRFLPTHRATFRTRSPLPPRAVPGHFGRLPTLPPLPAHRTPLVPPRSRISSSASWGGTVLSHWFTHRITFRCHAQTTPTELQTKDRYRDGRA